jgi:hypothetical protein
MSNPAYAVHRDSGSPLPMCLPVCRHQSSYGFFPNSTSILLVAVWAPVTVRRNTLLTVVVAAEPVDLRRAVKRWRAKSDRGSAGGDDDEVATSQRSTPLRDSCEPVTSKQQGKIVHFLFTQSVCRKAARTGGD